jgi:hypothetical protein
LRKGLIRVKESVKLAIINSNLTGWYAEDSFVRGMLRVSGSVNVMEED